MMDCETRGGQLPEVSNVQLQNQLFDLASKRGKLIVVTLLLSLLHAMPNALNLLFILHSIFVITFKKDPASKSRPS